MDNMNLSIVEAKKELRLQEWKERIRECRTSGLSVSEWCKRNDIGVKRYYYWHRKLWKRELRKIEQAERENEPLQFAQIDIQPTKGREIRIERNGWSLEISNEADLRIIREIMQMVAESV